MHKFVCFLPIMSQRRLLSGLLAKSSFLLERLHSGFGAATRAGLAMAEGDIRRSQISALFPASTTPWVRRKSSTWVMLITLQWADIFDYYNVMAIMKGMPME